MTEIPSDAPRSEDGNWWWDGAAWQPVSGQTSGDAAPPAEGDDHESLTHQWGEFLADEIDVPAMDDSTDQLS